MSAEPKPSKESLEKSRTTLADAMEYWKSVKDNPEYGGTQFDCIADAFALEFDAIRRERDSAAEPMKCGHPKSAQTLNMEEPFTADSPITRCSWCDAEKAPNFGRHIVRIDRSPMNRKVWLVELSCGHWSVKNVE